MSGEQKIVVDLRMEAARDHQQRRAAGAHRHRCEPGGRPDEGLMHSFMAIKRHGRPEEVAGMVAWLAGPEAGFVTTPGSCSCAAAPREG